MARALAVGAKRLFGEDKVHLTLLRTGTDTSGVLPPTKANFRRAFEAVRKAKPDDILVVYLAGHGVTLPGSTDTYGYLTQEARSTDLSDPAVRAQVAITSVATGGAQQLPHQREQVMQAADPLFVRGQLGEGCPPILRHQARGLLEGGHFEDA